MKNTLDHFYENESRHRQKEAVELAMTVLSQHAFPVGELTSFENEGFHIRFESVAECAGEVKCYSMLSMTDGGGVRFSNLDWKLFDEQGSAVASGRTTANGTFETDWLAAEQNLSLVISIPNAAGGPMDKQLVPATKNKPALNARTDRPYAMAGSKGSPNMNVSRDSNTIVFIPLPKERKIYVCIPSKVAFNRLGAVYVETHVPQQKNPVKCVLPVHFDETGFYETKLPIKVFNLMDLDSSYSFSAYGDAKTLIENSSVDELEAILRAYRGWGPEWVTQFSNLLESKKEWERDVENPYLD